MVRKQDPEEEVNPFGLPLKRADYPYFWIPSRNFHKRIRQKLNEGGKGWLVFCLLIVLAFVLATIRNLF